MVSVVWSRATLAPTTSLERSSFTFTPTTFLVPVDDFTISTLRCAIHFSLVISLRTSPIIWPTDWRDLSWLSVLVTSFFLSLTSNRSGLVERYSFGYFILAGHVEFSSARTPGSVYRVLSFKNNLNLNLIICKLLQCQSEYTSGWIFKPYQSQKLLEMAAFSMNYMVEPE